MSAHLAWLVIVVAALAALLAMLRIGRHAARHRVLLLALQAPIAAALAAALLLPHAPGPVQVHVLTEGADPGAAAENGTTVRLPDGPIVDGAPTWPGLPALLRAHPQIETLVVHGHGLDADGLAAVGDRGLRFLPAEPPQGLVALEAPRTVRPGALFALHGRVRTRGATLLRLLDPAGGVRAEATPDEDGTFALQAVAPAPGRHHFTLAVLVDDKEQQTRPIAVFARAPEPQKGVLLASAPSAELRALRRWAADAGLALDARITLAPGLPLQDASVRLDAATLAAVDLLLLDERSWPTGAAERAALRDAVAGGLGVLLRITGPLPRAVLEDLARFAGVGATGGDASAASTPAWLLRGVADGVPEPVTLPLRSGVPAAAPVPSAAAEPPAAIELHAWPVQFDADAAPLLSAADGRTLAAWRPAGQGRIGVVALSDTHRLQALAGRTHYASLWSHLWSELARGSDASPLVAESQPVQGHRVALCGGSGRLTVTAPDGGIEHLLRDPQAGACAAWYPNATGWHRIEAGNRTLELAVLHPSELARILQERRHDANAAHAAGNDAAPASPARHPPWAMLLLAAWLLLLATSWWLERHARTYVQPPAGAA